jgi:hypothetical protein
VVYSAEVLAVGALAVCSAGDGSVGDDSAVESVVDLPNLLLVKIQDEINVL